jgi:hypothetical protein
MVRISVDLPVNTNEISRGFLQYPQANVRIAPSYRLVPPCQIS